MNEDDELLNSLREMYKSKLPEKISELNSEWQKLSTQFTHDQLQSFYKFVHKFNGSSGSYGYQEISRELSKLELYLKQIMPTMTSLSEEQKKEIESLKQKVVKMIEMER